ncbi:MAG: DUF4846 domain-containing protein [Oscillospiraceae bacterium]|jgi:hypothetical protein|nr:DUF4846 domain-containing protein [Oscillospiraceae bacterium]
MKTYICLLLALTLCLGVLPGCGDGGEEAVSSPPPESAAPPPTPSPPPVKAPEGTTLLTRFRTPAGYTRVSAESDSFAAYLRALPLKEDGAPALLFDGKEKLTRTHEAVVDMDIGSTDVQQGSDALIRLRAEYLYAQGDYDRISYHFLSGFSFPFTRWAEGYRVSVNGKNVIWEKKSDPSQDYETLRRYLNTLFVYANTRSLAAELSIADEMRIGDVFISTEFGGVMVADMARHADTGEILCILAGAKIPAQEIQILKNPDNPQLSPWYPAPSGADLTTSEGDVFRPEHLKRFSEIPENSDDEAPAP